MKINLKIGTGVIIGRFQEDILHNGHKYLIDYSLERHLKTVILIGTRFKYNEKNPLPFIFIKQMILESYPGCNDLIISKINDVHNYPLWSKNVDKLVGELISDYAGIVFYVSRDSFKDKYSGKYKIVTLPEIYDVSSSDIRKEISQSMESNRSFRQGVIWAAINYYK